MSRKRKKEASSQDVHSAETSSQEAVQESVQDKFQAIRNAVHEQVETQEEAQVHIADKIQQIKGNIPSGETTGKPKKKKAKSVKKSGKKKKASGKSGKKRKKNSLFPQQGDSMFEVLRKSIFLMSTAVFVVCLGLIGKYFWENYQNKILNEDMWQQYVVRRHSYKQPENTGGWQEEYYYVLPGSATLMKTNPDVVGFIQIQDLEGKEEKPYIRYPVLQYKPEDHEPPETTNGNDYYLTRNINREPEKAGSIFLDFRNFFDYVKVEKKEYSSDGLLSVVYGQKYKNSDNLIIYGHNMHDYSMFGSLKKYINEPNYYDSHPIIQLNSNLYEYKYKIFGMIIVDIDDETDTKFDYWNSLDFYEEEAFYDYVNEVKRRTVRLTDVDVKYGDQLLTLSTCNSTFSEGRLVVFARLLRDGEDELEGCTSTPNPNIKWPNSYYKWRKKTYDPNAEFVPYG